MINYIIYRDYYASWMSLQARNGIRIENTDYNELKINKLKKSFKINNFF